MDKKIHHWGSEIINIHEKSLPALKIKHVLDSFKGRKLTKVLEIGSGQGKILKTIKKHYPKLELYGCDIRKPSKQTNHKFSLIKKDTLPYKDDFFDAVIIVDCLEHVPNYKKELSEINRILKKNGMFHCFVPCEGEAFSAYSFYKLVFGKDLYLKTKEHVNSFKKRQLIKELKNYFDIKKINYSYHLVGHIMDATLFTLMLNKKISTIFWNENKYYNKEEKGTIFGKGLNMLLGFANTIAYYESKLLRTIKFGAYGVHVTCVKKWK